MKVKETGQYEDPKPGSYIARCFGLIDFGTQPHTYGGESWSQRDVRIIFELPMTKMGGIYNADVKGKPFAVGTTMKQSLSVNAKLRKLLKGWRGRDFTREELAGFDLKNILGKPCRVNLVQSEDGKFINIDSVSPLGSGEKCPKQINEPIYVSLDPAEFESGAMDKLSEKVREKISKSPEYAALFHKAPEGVAPEGEPGSTKGYDPDVGF